MKELEEKINPFLEQKQYWRAKQYLRSRIKNSAKYNPQLFGLYGMVLSKMHDDLEAGKYFFLSNLRGPDYDDKIQLFLHRYTKTKKKKYLSLSCQFPKIARYRKIDDFPEPTRSDILKLGLKTGTRFEKMKTDFYKKFPKAEGIESTIIRVILGSLLIMLLVSVPIGIFTIWKWILNTVF